GPRDGRDPLLRRRPSAARPRHLRVGRSRGREGRARLETSGRRRRVARGRTHLTPPLSDRPELRAAPPRSGRPNRRKWNSRGGLTYLPACTTINSTNLISFAEGRFYSTSFTSRERSIHAINRRGARIRARRDSKERVHRG